MDSKLLKAFIILSQSRSYREASDKLFITQPALTKQINLLEQELDLCLFERNNHGSRLSEEGKLLYRSAVTLDEQIKHFLFIAKNIRAGKVENLNIAYTSSFLNIIPDVIKTFNFEHPNINIRLIEMRSTQQEQELLKGRIDLGFMQYPENEKLSSIPVGNDFLCVVTHDHSRTNEKNIEDLIDAHDLFLPNEAANPEIYYIINDYLNTLHLNEKPVHYLKNIYSVLALIESGMGVTILPYSIISFLKPNFSCQALPGFKSQWQLGLAWNKNLDIFPRTEFINSINDKS